MTNRADIMNLVIRSTPFSMPRAQTSMPMATVTNIQASISEGLPTIAPNARAEVEASAPSNMPDPNLKM